jgi:hypothetical protein
LESLPENAFCLIRSDFEFDSGLTTVGHMHIAKQPSGITSAELVTWNSGSPRQWGTKIDSGVSGSSAGPGWRTVPPGIVSARSGVGVDAHFSIRRGLQSGSGVTDESDLSLKDHHWQITSTARGVETIRDRSNEIPRDRFATMAGRVRTGPISAIDAGEMLVDESPQPATESNDEGASHIWAVQTEDKRGTPRLQVVGAESLEWGDSAFSTLRGPCVLSHPMHISWISGGCNGVGVMPFWESGMEREYFAGRSCGKGELLCLEVPGRA